MKFLQRLLAILSGTVFRLAIYGFILAATFVTLFGNTVIFKRSFVQAKIYQEYVQTVLNDAIKTQQTTNSLPLNDRHIQTIIKESFPPATLQVDAETVMDSAYSWLRGTTAAPQFSVDFSPNLTRLANKLSAYGFARLQAQPVCTTQPTSINPFTDTCRPAFFDYAMAQAQLATSIRDSNSLLPKTKFTGADLPHDNKHASFAQQYSYAPKLYQLALKAPLILAGIAILSGLGIVFANPQKRRGVNRLAVSIISSSVVTILSPIILLYVLPKVLNGAFSETSTTSQSVVSNVTSEITITFNSRLIAIGLAVAALGLVLYVIERSTRPRSKYTRIRRTSGIISSEAPKKKSFGRPKLVDLPVQSSEGTLATSKYQKDKKYRTIPKGDL